MNPEDPQLPPVPQPTPVAAPVSAASQAQPIAPAGQAFSPQPTTPDLALKRIHSAGKWAIGLGVLTVVVGILLDVFLSGSSSNDSTSVGLSLGVNIVSGGLFIWWGRKLLAISAESIGRAVRTLNELLILLIVMLILKLLTAGGGVGLINLVVFIYVIKAKNDIKKLAASAVTPA